MASRDPEGGALDNRTASKRRVARHSSPPGTEVAMLPLGLARHELLVPTAGRSFTDVTIAVAAWLATLNAREGLLNLFLRHTSASLTIQENSDPDVQRDLLQALDRLAPEGTGYRHNLEGPDDMPAHIKSMITSVSLSIPVVEGRLALGRWQAIYLVEHRRQGSDRTIAIHFIGATGRA
jgi:secondary thiamine-phosphate synthase enzyme